jgi:hypothetical protein
MLLRGHVFRAMSVVRIGVVALGVAYAGPALRGAMAASQPTGAPAVDEDLNSKGVALRLAGNNKAALEPFQKAYDLTHSARATAQLGLVYQSLGRWELAEPLVAKAVQSRDDSWIKKYEGELGRALEVIRKHVAHVEIVSDPPQSDVVVNGAVAVRLPLAQPVTVTVGQVDLEFRATGYRSAVRTVTVNAYQYERIFVRLERESLSSPPDGERARRELAAPAQPGPALNPGRTWKTPAGAAIGAGGLGLLAWGIVWIAIDGHSNGTNSAGAPIGYSTKTAGWIMTGAGAAAAIAGSVLIYSDASRPSQISLGITPAALLLSGLC